MPRCSFGNKTARYEVIDWMASRHACLQIVVSITAGNANGITQVDADAVMSLTRDTGASLSFWAMTFAVLIIAKWGRHVSKWMHSCPCHSKEERSLDSAFAHTETYEWLLILGEECLTCYTFCC